VVGGNRNGIQLVKIAPVIAALLGEYRPGLSLGNYRKEKLSVWLRLDKYFSMFDHHFVS